MQRTLFLYRTLWKTIVCFYPMRFQHLGVIDNDTTITKYIMIIIGEDKSVVLI